MPNAKLSHLEIVVSSIPDVEPFYTSVLGFAVTDRSEGSGDGSMVFLSQDPDEHHQLVLRQSSGESDRDHLDHIAFRLDTLAELREVLATARGARIDRIETVSHGSTWSVYLPDPEGNRIEHFVDTPWPVTQPCRFDVDLDLDDEALVAATEARIRDLGLLTQPTGR